MRHFGESSRLHCVHDRLLISLCRRAQSSAFPFHLLLTRSKKKDGLPSWRYSRPHLIPKSLWNGRAEFARLHLHLPSASRASLPLDSFSIGLG